MDSKRFDAITGSFADTHSRRGALRLLGLAALGASGLAVLGHEDGQAKKKKRKKKGSRRNSGSTGTLSGSRQDRCGGPVGICNADPTPCGTTAEGKICGCERSVEGNNVCVNSGADNVCKSAVECTSTDGPEATSCRSQVGFHFYCQEAKRSGNQFCGCGFGTATGRVCVPECDNTSPY
jgi:hypothetical protein